jgi:hypothetical protein
MSAGRLTDRLRFDSTPLPWPGDRRARRRTDPFFSTVVEPERVLFGILCGAAGLWAGLCVYLLVAR